jgi:hypothetical protein
LPAAFEFDLLQAAVGLIGAEPAWLRGSGKKRIWSLIRGVDENNASGNESGLKRLGCRERGATAAPRGPTHAVSET